MSPNEVESLINELKAVEAHIRRIRQQLEEELREKQWKELRTKILANSQTS